ncbi:uncharacterized protein LOC143916461 [Arctopsyche grandis]|uniref:uncharacterized protein LOC143916461 n=1 Tax=Arctopsyche grandis TaxID=121162 RepID=UPI00406D8AE0
MVDRPSFVYMFDCPSEAVSRFFAPPVSVSVNALGSAPPCSTRPPLVLPERCIPLQYRRYRVYPTCNPSSLSHCMCLMQFGCWWTGCVLKRNAFVFVLVRLVSRDGAHEVDSPCMGKPP